MFKPLPFRDFISYVGILIGIEWAVLEVWRHQMEKRDVSVIRILDVDKENMVEIARILPGGEVKLYDGIKPEVAASKFWRIMMEQKLHYKIQTSIEDKFVAENNPQQIRKLVDWIKVYGADDYYVDCGTITTFEIQTYGGGSLAGPMEKLTQEGCIIRRMRK